MNFYRLKHTTSGTVTDKIQNWADLDLSVVYDEPYYKVEFSFPADICDPDFITALNTDVGNDICKEINLEFEYSCDGNSWLKMLDLKSFIYQYETDCLGCKVSVPMEFGNKLTRLLESESEELCIVAPTEVSVPQFQSGGNHFVRATGADKKIKVIKVVDLIKEFLQAFGGGTAVISGDLFTESFQQEKWELAFAGVTAGSVVSIEFDTAIGSTYKVDATIQTGDNAAQVIANAILADNYGGSASTAHSIDMLQLVHRISCATVSGNTVTITSDFPLTFNKNTASVGTITPTKTQQFKYGLADMVITGKGITDQVCTNWASLVKFLTSIHPMVFKATADGVEINSYWDAFDQSTPASTTINEGNEQVLRYDKDRLNGKIRGGIDFPISNYETSQTNWALYGVKTNQAPLVSPGAASTFYTNLTGAAQSVTIAGEVTILNTNNTTQQVTVQFRKNGTNELVLPTAQGLGLKTVSANSEGVFTVNEPGLNNQVSTYQAKTICLLPNESIDILVVDLLGNDKTADYNYVVTKTSLFIVSQSGNDQTFPGMKEDNGMFRDGPYMDSCFPNCPGIFGDEQNEEFYTGLGYRLSQQVDELADYNETFFISFIDSAGTGLRTFERCFYFPNSSYTCWNNNVAKMYFHNMPIQPPYITYLMGRTFPGCYASKSFEFIRGYSGNYSSAFNTRIKELAGDSAKLYEGEFSSCLPLSSFLKVTEEGKIQSAVCGRSDTAAVVRSASFNLADGTGEYILSLA